jgi:hypothetical protein
LSGGALPPSPKNPTNSEKPRIVERGAFSEEVELGHHLRAKAVDEELEDLAINFGQ